MKINRRKVYWDTTCWLAWLNDERDWPANVITGIQDVVYEVEMNSAVLFTSAITRAEIFFGRLTLDQKNLFAKLMRRTNVTEVSADPRIMDRASSIREYHAARGQNIHTPDATHLATAVLYRADEFQTMDGLGKSGSKRALLKLNGDVGGYKLMIVHPYPRQTPPAQAISIKGPLFPDEGANEEKIEQQITNPLELQQDVTGSNGDATRAPKAREEKGQ